MRYANIVHLSDLHLKTEEGARYNQSIVLEGLIEDIAHIKDTQLRPDCIVFSGDLVNSADDKVSLDDAIATLQLIAEAAGLDDNRVFICPGNHDASRAAVGPNIPALSTLRSAVTDTDSLNSLSSNLKMVDHVGSAFSAFSKIQSSFGSSFVVSNDALVGKAVDGG